MSELRAKERPQMEPESTANPRRLSEELDQLLAEGFSEFWFGHTAAARRAALIAEGRAADVHEPPAGAQ